VKENKGFQKQSLEFGYERKNKSFIKLLLNFMNKIKDVQLEKEDVET
jgi:hypothetical protein